MTPEQKEKDEKERAKEAADAAEARKDVMMIMACIFGILIVISALMVSLPILISRTLLLTLFLSQLGAAWMLGARFDLAFQNVKQGNLKPAHPTDINHVEL